MVTSVPTITTITITMPSNETGSGATTSGGIRVQHYYPVGQLFKQKVLVGDLGSWGGEDSSAGTTTLNGALEIMHLEQVVQELCFSRRYTISRFRNKFYKSRN